MKFNLLITIGFITMFLFSCKKEKKVFSDNEIPGYSEVSTLQVENYVNRLFIDLIGREPLDSEMTLEVLALEENSLSQSARITLIEKLQLNTDSLPNDSSYSIAYFKKLYEDTKARLLEGSSDAELTTELIQFQNMAIADSINGNFVNYELNKAAANKLASVLSSNYLLRIGEITIQDMYTFMILNNIYDRINMNSFNFINATFDDLYYRFPTQAEFDNSFPIIENNEAGVILGEVAQNKNEYVQILVSNPEYNEGLVRWAFLSLLSREPNTSESFELINEFEEHNSILEIQKRILITNEYAGF